MTALATDNFNRANSASLGANWTVVTSEQAMKIASNAAQGIEAGGDSGDFYNAVTWPNDQYAQANITATATGYSAGDGPGVGVRISSSARTYYRVIANHLASNNVRMKKMVAGTGTDLGTWTNALTNGDLLYLSASGTTLIASIQSVQVGSVTDSAITLGNAGILYSSEGNISQTGTMDNFEGGDLPGGLPPGLGPNEMMDEPGMTTSFLAAMMR